MRRLKECMDGGGVVVNAIIYAEISGQFPFHAEVTFLLKKLEVELEDIPWDAAYLAGKSQRAYRGAGGMRERVLADFMIGAHAEQKGYRILTRDQARYRTYFPRVDVIAPDTHP